LFLQFLQSTEHKEAFLELAHVVAQADGFINRKEQGFIKSFMAEMNMQESAYTPSEVRELSEIIGKVNDEQVKNIFFAEILLLIFADGDYNDDEKQMAKSIAEQFGFTEETYEAFKNWVIRLDQLKIEGFKLILKC